ncbi:hypothetical protein SAMN02910298_01254 [Pseudobutyrivibrio sp. YE44]|uniref:hypothetical protein n=1 Tax=Pseudobutyrivibrio sp. YE44 TaxID=1520802 RepID=UPI00087F2B9B|nr:hypothetical protein [Pseudobutyrivibrio sp. YE44]SDB25038.1 hypothetical protein SAMN02910298_01254 [Pseudobutyrivibrio sp. YE44]
MYLKKAILWSVLLVLFMTACTKNEANSKTDEIIVKDQANKNEKNSDSIASDNTIVDKIDWKHFEEQMTPDEKTDFQDYLPVLERREKFYSLDLDNRQSSLQEYMEDLKVDEPKDVGELVLIDLDNQNGKELVIHIIESGGHYLILTRDDDNIYVVLRSERCFEELQKDGKYYGSGGAGDWYFRRMKIDSSGMEEILLGESHGEQKEDGSYGNRLEVGGKVVNEDIYDWMNNNYGDPVEWIH